MHRAAWLIAWGITLVVSGCEESNYANKDKGVVPLHDGGTGSERPLDDRGVITGDGPRADQGVPLTDGPQPDRGPQNCNSSCDVTFELADGGESDVVLMGEFDDWSTGKPMTKSGGKWTVTLELQHGQTVQYKFAKNGKTDWITDPSAPSCAEIGSNRNSYRVVECANPCPVTTTNDWRDGVLYFAMLDRFKNGDASNDRPVGERFGRQVRPIADWMGGDLQGLIDKIQDGYFTRLGVSILWISNPIAAADGAWDGNYDEIYTGYHGYWPTDMNAIEPRLGDRQLLKKMIEEAHKVGIKVIMDYPMNHVHQDSPHFTAHPEWFWSYQLNGQDCKCGSAVCSWEGPDKERCWFDPFLPDFNYTVAAARQFSFDNLVSWAKDVGGDGSNVGFDGFRMDAVKHIDLSWVTGQRQRLDTEFPGRFIWTVGETFTGSKELIKNYIGKDKLHGQFDFPLHDSIRGVVVQRGGSMKDLGHFVEDNRCPYGSSSLMSTFMGNHDKQRLIHDALNQFYGPFDFPAQPGGSEPYERMAVGFAFLMTTPGVPLIYYGDEVGLAGGTDPDNRRMMPWNGQTYAQAGNDDAQTLEINTAQAALLARVKKLTSIRNTHPVLRRAYPTIDWNATTDQVLVYEMKLGAERLIVVLNRGDQAQSGINVGGGSFKDLISGASVDGSSVSLGARSAMILE